MTPKSPLGKDHRDGAGHLEPAYEAALRARVCHKEPRSSERAFIGTMRTADTRAEDCAEEFVKTVTSGSDGGEHALEEEDNGDREGGPFVETDGDVEFAHGPDGSNPRGATREPFPTT